MSDKRNYAPELDTSDELEGEEITYFQELIGMLRWAIELGRVDIYHEVSLLSQFQASPREGHLEELLHIFAYLKHKPKLQLIFSAQPPALPEVDFNFETDEFLDHYCGAEEELPPNMPEPRGRAVDITAFVDASHASNKVNRRSHTGYLIFVQRAPIIWYSKLQKTVESSAFGSEFVAMRTLIEHNRALQYKLRMFGIPFYDSTKILSDNESVVNNSSKLASTLNKKHNSIACHATRWAVAAGEAVVGWIPTSQNLVDALTKRLPKAARERLFGGWTF